MNKEEGATMRLARSLIRDMAQGWPVEELAEQPDKVCEEITILLGDKFNFDTGEGK